MASYLTAVVLLLLQCGHVHCQFLNNDHHHKFMEVVHAAQEYTDASEVRREVQALNLFDASMVAELASDAELAGQLIPQLTKYCQDANQWLGVRESCAGGVQGYFCALLEWTKAVAANCSALTEAACAECRQKQTAAKSRDGLWPLRVVDMIGKPPPYFLAGNLHWMGEYELCTSIDVSVTAGPGGKSAPLKGRYCTMALGTDGSRPNPQQTLAARSAFSGGSNATNNPCPPPTGSGPPGKKHMLSARTKRQAIPGISISCEKSPIRIGFCLPSTCNNTEANILARTNVPGSCYVYCEEDREWTVGGLIMVGVIAGAFLITTVAAIYDVLWYQRNLRRIEKNVQTHANAEIWSVNGGTKQSDAKRTVATAKRKYHNQLPVVAKLALCVSLYSNGRKLFSTKSSPDAIPCLNGIRVFGMAWVVLGHTYSFVVTFVTNIAVMLQDLAPNFPFHFVLNGTPSVDIFFTLSGFLLTYLFLLGANKNGGKQLKSAKFWIMYYVHRYIRLTPLYALMILIASVLYQNLGDGPLFLGYEDLTNKCRDNLGWLRSLLYVSNLWGEFADQCIAWTWYLANDMQFYAFAPLILVPLFYFPIGGILFALLLIVVSAVARGIVTNSNEYGPGAVLVLNDPHGYQSRDVGRSNDLYGKPWMRCGPFLVGMLCAYIVVRLKRKARLHICLTALLWLVAFGMMLAVIFGLYPYAQTGDMNPILIALYAALHRTAFGLGVAIVIFLCSTGNGGPINAFLSWGVFGPLSRLTYAAYLVHELVIFHFYMNMRKLVYFTHLQMAFYYMGAWLLTYMVSVGLSLLFEAPVIQLEKFIFSQARPVGDKPKVHPNGAKAPVTNGEHL